MGGVSGCEGCTKTYLRKAVSDMSIPLGLLICLGEIAGYILLELCLILYLDRYPPI